MFLSRLQAAQAEVSAELKGEKQKKDRERQAEEGGGEAVAFVLNRTNTNIAVSKKHLHPLAA